VYWKLVIATNILVMSQANCLPDRHFNSFCFQRSGLSGDSRIDEKSFGAPHCSNCANACTDLLVNRVATVQAALR
jgi:hypothetical protein